MIGSVYEMGHGFKGLLSYLETGEGGRVRRVDRVGWMEFRNLPTRDAEVAACMMAATAAGSVSNTPTPLFHFSISCAPGDPVDERALRGIADRVIRDLGLAEYEVVIVAHKDRSHPHLHFAVNRVHPERFTLWSPWKSKTRIERINRALEVELGLRVVPGHLARVPQRERDGFATGEAREVEPRPSLAPKRGGVSFLTEVRRRALPVLEQARSWAELERGLAECGLSLYAKGGGFRLGDGVRDVKASEVQREFSRFHLEKRFGAWPDYHAQKAVASLAPAVERAPQVEAPAVHPEPQRAPEPRARGAHPVQFGDAGFGIAEMFGEGSGPELKRHGADTERGRAPQPERTVSEPTPAPIAPAVRPPQGPALELAPPDLATVPERRDPQFGDAGHGIAERFGYGRPAEPERSGIEVVRDTMPEAEREEAAPAPMPSEPAVPPPQPPASAVQLDLPLPPPAVEVTRPAREADPAPARPEPTPVVEPRAPARAAQPPERVPPSKAVEVPAPVHPPARRVEPVAPEPLPVRRVEPPAPPVSPPPRRRQVEPRPLTERERYAAVLRQFRQKLARLYRDPQAARRAIAAEFYVSGAAATVLTLVTAPERFGPLRISAGREHAADAAAWAATYAAGQDGRVRAAARHVADLYRRADARESAEQVLDEAGKDVRDAKSPRKVLSDREHQAKQAPDRVMNGLREVYAKPREALGRVRAYRASHGDEAAVAAVRGQPERFGALRAYETRWFGLVRDTNAARSYAGSLAMTLRAAFGAEEDRPTPDDLTRADEAVRAAQEAARRAMRALPATPAQTFREEAARLLQQAVQRGTDRAGRLLRQLAPMLPEAALSHARKAMFPPSTWSPSAGGSGITDTAAPIVDRLKHERGRGGIDF
ncbi:MAG TPA: relaxase/mobilization nuclease domain-containing protein [Longimicrobium sp.]|nr:relaxase/mobilization nuclease domain-containing protein [Longimicrobium sp.]